MGATFFFGGGGGGGCFYSNNQYTMEIFLYCIFNGILRTQWTGKIICPGVHFDRKWFVRSRGLSSKFYRPSYYIGCKILA